MIEFFQGPRHLEITLTIPDKLGRPIIPEGLDPSRQVDRNELGHLSTITSDNGARLLNMLEHLRKGIETQGLEQQWTLWNSQLRGFGQTEGKGCV